jgi:hypothetical protein
LGFRIVSGALLGTAEAAVRYFANKCAPGGDHFLLDLSGGSTNSGSLHSAEFAVDLRAEQLAFTRKLGGLRFAGLCGKRYAKLF